MLCRGLEWLDALAERTRNRPDNQRGSPDVTRGKGFAVFHPTHALSAEGCGVA